MAQLIEHHGPVVRRGLQDKIPNRWRWRSILTVDDIMQVAYMNAYLNIGSLELKDEGSFRQWLATIAKRNLLDTVQMLQAKRRGGDRRRMGLGEGDSYVALCELLDGTTSTTSTPSRTAARNEACGALQRALQELPRIYRQVVQMYDLEGRAVGKVAEDLQRSPGAVYMLRARAHRLLRELMGTASKYLSD